MAEDEAGRRARPRAAAPPPIVRARPSSRLTTPMLFRSGWFVGIEGERVLERGQRRHRVVELAERGAEVDEGGRRTTASDRRPAGSRRARGAGRPRRATAWRFRSAPPRSRRKRDCPIERGARAGGVVGLAARAGEREVRDRATRGAMRDCLAAEPDTLRRPRPACTPRPVADSTRVSDTEDTKDTEGTCSSSLCPLCPLCRVYAANYPDRRVRTPRHGPRRRSASGAQRSSAARSAVATMRSPSSSRSIHVWSR